MGTPLLYRRPPRLLTRLAWVTTCALACAASAYADPVPDGSIADSMPPSPLSGGRLLLTQGVSSIEGAAGGGLTPWALISGYDTGNQVGGNVHDTYIKTQDYSLNTYGVALGIGNRFEFSLAKQSLDTRQAGATLGLGAGYTLTQDIVGFKVRLLGDAVLDQDSWLPQVAAGMQFKHSENGALLDAIGAKSHSGTDFYLSATKLLLDQSLLFDTTLRLTKANQYGLLGFGGDNSDSYHPEFEGSLAYLISKRLAVGVEYRTKPNNLSFAREQNAYDAFAVWTVNKAISLTAAYVQLGDIATIKDQHGYYVSAQLGF